MRVKGLDYLHFLWFAPCRRASLEISADAVVHGRARRPAGLRAGLSGVPGM